MRLSIVFLLAYVQLHRVLGQQCQPFTSLDIYSQTTGGEASLPSTLPDTPSASTPYVVGDMAEIGQTVPMTCAASNGYYPEAYLDTSSAPGGIILFTCELILDPADDMCGSTAKWVSSVVLNEPSDSTSVCQKLTCEPFSDLLLQVSNTDANANSCMLTTTTVPASSDADEDTVCTIAPCAPGFVANGDDYTCEAATGTHVTSTGIWNGDAQCYQGCSLDIGDNTGGLTADYSGGFEFTNCVGDIVVPNEIIERGGQCRLACTDANEAVDSDAIVEVSCNNNGQMVFTDSVPSATCVTRPTVCPDDLSAANVDSSVDGASDCSGAVTVGNSCTASCTGSLEGDASLLDDYICVIDGASRVGRWELGSGADHPVCIAGTSMVHISVVIISLL